MLGSFFRSLPLFAFLPCLLCLLSLLSLPLYALMICVSLVGLPLVFILMLPHLASCCFRCSLAFFYVHCEPLLLVHFFPVAPFPISLTPVQ